MSKALEAKPDAEPSVGFQPLTWWKAATLVFGAAACFHAAYTPAKQGPLALLIVGYVVCVVQLARLRTTRQSFYVGVLTGLLCFGPQLGFFWRIFGPAAIALWLVLAFWLALFVALTHLALVRFGPSRAVWLVPFLWTGLEYFRSELYYLKFSWLNVGFAFSHRQIDPLNACGVYGVGFIASALAAWFLRRHPKWVTAGLLTLICSICVVYSLITFATRTPNLWMAGVQLEFPTASEIEQALDKIIVPRTNVDLIVLSEYTLDGEPTDALKDWCRANQKFLIVGGKDSSPGTNYYNTAFVISTNGEVVFKQVKSVPIQFFKDGLPAPEQKVWDSPWGKIGICICYDLSYTRVTDELVRQGAQMLIVPTMDVADWGAHQHELHARVAPVRAAEYGIPIFRLASSGISQGVTGSGLVRATAPFPGEGEMIFFGVNLNPRRRGSLPLDRYLAPLCVGVTGLFVAWLAVDGLRRKQKRC
jgi:apolipoprotein N-acyltransferase